MGRLCTDGKQRFLISECTLIGGDSGGPLFDLSGKLVGIHSSIGPMLKINNHVPVSVFRRDWDKLLSGRHWGQLGLHPMADPESPVLGFAMMDVLGVDGVVVEDVVVNSPADTAASSRGTSSLTWTAAASVPCGTCSVSWAGTVPGKPFRW